MKMGFWLGVVVAVGVGSFWSGRWSARQPALPADPSEARPSAGPILASYDGVQIDLQALQQRLLEEDPVVQRQLQDPERLSEYLREWIRVSVLAQEARSSGIADRPQLRRERERRLADAYLQAELAEAGAGKPIDESQLRAAFDAHLAEYQRPEQFELAVIRFLPREGNEPSERVRARADAAEERLHHDLKKDPYAFDLLARSVSEDPAGRARGGRLAPLARDAVETRFGADTLQALSQAQPGAILPQPVKDGAGYALLKLVRHRAAVAPSFEEIRASLRLRLTSEQKKQAYDALIGQVERAAHVTVNESAVRSASTRIQRKN